MRKLNQQGSVISVIIIVFSVLAMLGLAGFGGWAYTTRQDYKNNSDAKSAEAVAKTIDEEKAKKDAEFAEREKQPYDTYTSPAPLGSVKLMYPKTWSAYIDETGQAGSPLTGYFYPGFVPNVTGRDTTFPLRIQIVNAVYDQQLRQYDSLIQSGSLRLSPYRAPLVQGVLGARIDGKIVPGNDKVDGTMILLPLRDKTLILTSEAQVYIADFEAAVLANLTFVP